MSTETRERLDKIVEQLTYLQETIGRMSVTLSMGMDAVALVMSANKALRLTVIGLTRTIEALTSGRLEIELAKNLTKEKQ